MMKHEMRWVVAILTIASVVCLAALAYMIWGQPERPQVGATNFEECVGAGNPVMESHPRQCNDVRTGETFVEQIDGPTDDELELSRQDYRSTKGVSIQIDDWAENRVITSPLTITGRVPGSWSHEAVFSIDLVVEQDIVVSRATAQLDGDWMTDQPVPFRATLEFDSEVAGKDGMIVLHKANPSGLAENDDSLALPVRLAD